MEEYRAVLQAAVEQAGEAEEDGQSGDGTWNGREQVVGVIVDTDSASPRLGECQAHEMADDDKDHAPVEERGRQAQQLGLIDLGGVGGPAELVGAPPPEYADDECGDGQPRERTPEEVIKHSVSLDEVRLGGGEGKIGDAHHLGRRAGADEVHVLLGGIGVDFRQSFAQRDDQADIGRTYV